MLAYSTEATKGRYIAMFWMVRNMLTVSERVMLKPGQTSRYSIWALSSALASHWARISTK